MSKSTFVNGTVVTPAFLNAINAPVYRATPENDGEIPYPDLAGMTDVESAISAAAAAGVSAASAETTRAENSESALNTAISYEATARALADAALSNSIAGLSEKEVDDLFSTRCVLVAIGAGGIALDDTATAGTLTVAKLAPKIYSITIDAILPASIQTSVAKRWAIAIDSSSTPLGYAFARMLAAFVASGSYAIPGIFQAGFTTALDQASTMIPCKLTVDTTGTKAVRNAYSSVWWIDINPQTTTAAGNWVNALTRFSFSQILIAP